MSLTIELPSYRSGWKNSELYKKLKETWSTLECDVLAQYGGGGNPHIFHVFAVPRDEFGVKLKAGFHYVARSLPALTATMFDEYGANRFGSDAIDDLIARFIEEVKSGDLFRRDELSDEAYEAMMHRFGQSLPWNS